MRRLRAALLLPALASLAIAGAGCGDDDDSGDAGATEVEATIKTFMYEPDPLEVAAGTTVTWTNEDDIEHTVTAGKEGSPGDGFDERLDGAGTTAEVTFDEPGTYAYFCSLHAGMDGTVIVE